MAARNTEYNGGGSGAELTREGVTPLQYLKSRGVVVYKGRIGPSSQKEKGVDVSIAIDLVRLTFEQEYEVAIIVS